MAVLLLTVMGAFALSQASVVSPGPPGTFELLILHNNDMHARFEQTSQLSGACTTSDREAGKCYGGFPRVAHVVKEARRAAATGEGPPVLYLNAGDTYTGTVWFTIYKWKIAAEFINALQPDAVSLGNSEFKANSNELSPFLEELKPTILTANVILNSAEGKQKIQKSAIFNINDVKVGIVGYLTPESKILDSSGNIEYVDEVLAIREEVEKLKTEGVKIIIALGHSESKDLEIAKEVEGLDLVIAGYKNSYFWNGTAADNDSDEAVVVTQDSGRKVPVVQSHAYSKYLGHLTLRFDAYGEISSFESGAVLLDDTIAQDPETVQTIEKYREEITSTAEVVVGATAVVLDGDTCGLEECNFGNLITDAITYIYAIRFEGDNWTDAPIAVINSGSITGSVAPSDRPASVTRGDLWAVLPAESNVVAVTLTAAALMEMLEHSVAEYNPTNPTGQFLQFSGIRVVYDLAQPPGSRVVSIVARCYSCLVPDFYVIDSWRTYTVLMPESLADGAYGYSMFEGMPRVNVGEDEASVVAEFIGRRSPVYPEVAQRITLLNVDSIEVEPEPEPEVEPEPEPEPEESAPDSAVALQTSFILVLGIFMNNIMM